MNLIFGRWPHGRHIYKGPASGSSSINTTGSSTPLIDNVFAIKCYGKDGIKTAEYSSTAGENNVKSIRFELVETGCGKFEIVFSKMPDENNFRYDQRIDIHLFNDSRPWYSGRVQSRPVSGSTDATFKVSGSGHYGLLSRVLVSGNFKGVDVADIVKEIGMMVEEKVGIRAISSEIVKTGYLVTNISFDGETAQEAIQQLTEFAANYVSGVDEYNRLYFKKISSDVNEQARFWVGEHLDDFSPQEDVEELVNYARVKGGKLNSDGTNWLAVVEDIESQGKYGRREAVWSLPSAFSEADAQRWGWENLSITKDPKRSATIQGVRLKYPANDGSFDVRKLSTRGRAAIFTAEGIPHYFPITTISYSMAGKGIQCEIKLGKPIQNWTDWIAANERRAKDQEFLQANNTKQLV